MRHRDRIVLLKIIEAIETGLKVFDDTPLEEFLKNDGMKLSMSMTVIRVGELVKTLTSEFRKKNSQVPWRDITGFRDVAAHKYEIIDMAEVYDTIQEDFPELKNKIVKDLIEE